MSRLKMSVWTGPTASGPDGNCVEAMLAGAADERPAHKAAASELVLVRDSKDATVRGWRLMRPNGQRLWTV